MKHKPQRLFRRLDEDDYAGMCPFEIVRLYLDMTAKINENQVDEDHLHPDDKEEIDKVKDEMMCAHLPDKARIFMNLYREKERDLYRPFLIPVSDLQYKFRPPLSGQAQPSPGLL